MATRYAPIQAYGQPIDGEPPLDSVSFGYVALRFFSFSPRINTWAYAFHVCESIVLNETGGVLANQLMLHGSKCTRGRTTPDFKFLVDEDFLRIVVPFLPLSHDVIFRALIYVKSSLLYRMLPKVSSLFALNNKGKYRSVRCSTSREHQDSQKPYRIFLTGLAIDQVELDWMAADVLLNKRMIAYFQHLPNRIIKNHGDITQNIRNMQGPVNVAGCSMYPRTITATLVSLCGSNIDERRFLQALIAGAFSNKTVEACTHVLGPLAERIRAIDSMHAVFQVPAPMQDSSDDQRMTLLANAMLAPKPDQSLNICLTAQFGTNDDNWREISFFDYSIYSGGEFRALFDPKPLDFSVKTTLSLRNAPPGVYYDKEDDCFYIKSNTNYYLFMKHGKISETVSIDLPNEVLIKTDLIWLTPTGKLSIDFSSYFSDLHLPYAYFDSDEGWDLVNAKKANSITEKANYIFTERDCENAEGFKKKVLRAIMRRK